MKTMQTLGKWTKLDDGTFGVEFRVGGRGAEFVGATGRVQAKNGKVTTVRLVTIVKDYGERDVVVFTATEVLS